MSHTETTAACFTLKTKKIWFTFGIVITPPGIKFPILPAVEIHKLVGNDQKPADIACNAAAKAGKGVAPPAPAPAKLCHVLEKVETTPILTLVATCDYGDCCRGRVVFSALSTIRYG